MGCVWQRFYTYPTRKASSAFLLQELQEKLLASRTSFNIGIYFCALQLCFVEMQDNQRASSSNYMSDKKPECFWGCFGAGVDRGRLGFFWLILMPFLKHFSNCEIWHSLTFFLPCTREIWTWGIAPLLWHRVVQSSHLNSTILLSWFLSHGIFLAGNKAKQRSPAKTSENRTLCRLLQ